MEFGNDVMVIRVEPFGHFAGHRAGMPAAGAVGLSLARSTGDLEPQREVNSVSVPLETGRHAPEQAAHVEHLIVKAEIVGGNKVNAGLLLRKPMGLPQLGPRAVEFFKRKVSFPKGFRGAFQFALFPDAGKSKIVGFDGTVHPTIICAGSPFS
jgi:hypothetical protein